MFQLLLLSLIRGSPCKTPVYILKVSASPSGVRTRADVSMYIVFIAINYQVGDTIGAEDVKHGVTIYGIERFAEVDKNKHQTLCCGCEFPQRFFAELEYVMLLSGVGGTILVGVEKIVYYGTYPVQNEEVVDFGGNLGE